MEGCQAAEPQVDSFPLLCSRTTSSRPITSMRAGGREGTETGNTALRSSGWVSVNDQVHEKQLVVSGCFKYLRPVSHTVFLFPPGVSFLCIRLQW